mmetsp:Transcript_8415/g.14166  ORF Transcript_8415/g.14166 Transcript_8415/m.14166 type:complete len:230 (-) Transcript_8415:52-741(-)
MKRGRLPVVRIRERIDLLENEHSLPTPPNPPNAPRLKQPRSSAAQDCTHIIDLDGGDDGVVPKPNVEGPSLPHILPTSNTPDTDENVQCIGRRGCLANSDLPHARSLCGHFPFSQEPCEQNATCCAACWCFVCDKKATGCSSWVTLHCHAFDNKLWRDARASARRGEPFFTGQSVFYTRRDGSLSLAKVINVHSDPGEDSVTILTDEHEVNTVLQRITQAPLTGNLGQR